MKLSPVKPIDILACQEECANIFGFDFDIKFCKMPDDNSLIETKKTGEENKLQTSQLSIKRDGNKLDLRPRFDNCLGISSFC
jgi:hypothetical protein